MLGTTTSFDFPMGSAIGTIQCLDITILEDARVEGDETVTVELSLMPTGMGIITGNERTTITITDNEGSLN